VSRLSTKECQFHLRLKDQQLNLIESGRSYHIVESLQALGGMDGVREAIDEESQWVCQENEDQDMEEPQPEPSTAEIDEPQPGRSNFQTNYQTEKLVLEEKILPQLSLHT